MPERAITQIDILIHPDYHQLWDNSNPNHKPFRRRWDNRVATLANKPNTVLFYFPAVPEKLKSSPYPEYPLLQSAQELYEYECTRRQNYARLLGNRFFWFSPTWPITDKPAKNLQERNLRYNPQKMQLYAYGEYRHLCVNDWLNYIGKQLGIPLRQQHIIKWMSPSVEELECSHPIKTVIEAVYRISYILQGS